MCVGEESLQWGHLFNAAYSYSRALRTTCAHHMNCIDAESNRQQRLFWGVLCFLLFKKKNKIRGSINYDHIFWKCTGIKYPYGTYHCSFSSQTFPVEELSHWPLTSALLVWSLGNLSPEANVSPVAEARTSLLKCIKSLLRSILWMTIPYRRKKKARGKPDWPEILYSLRLKYKLEL